MNRFASLMIAAAILSSMRTGAIAAEEEAPTSALPDYATALADTANWRCVEPENLIIYDTSQGRILIEALPSVAPATVEQFRAIIRSGDFAGTSFHRVIDDFMAQGGDIFALKGRESGLPDIPGEFVFKRKPSEMPFDLIGRPETATNGYYMGFPMQTQSRFLAEMTADGMVESWIPHCASVVSTARTEDPNSANSQFFLMRHTRQHLDREYTAWGRIVSGQDVVMSIKHGPSAQNGAVRQPDILVKAQMAADLPESERPTVLVQRTDGPAFASSLEADEDTNVCDLPPVPTIVAP